MHKSTILLVKFRIKHYQWFSCANGMIKMNLDLGIKLIVIELLSKIRNEVYRCNGLSANYKRWWCVFIV